MITVFADDTRYDIEEGTTFGQFLKIEDFDEGHYAINGVAKPLDTVLENYNVIEEMGDDADFTHFDPATYGESSSTNLENPNVVEVELRDFTGFSGKIWVANNLAAVKERYNQPVSIQVIRDGLIVPGVTELKTGDNLLVVPAGGVKGA